MGFKYDHEEARRKSVDLMFRLRGPALFFHAFLVGGFFVYLYLQDPTFIRVGIIYIVIFAISLYREVKIQRAINEAKS